MVWHAVALVLFVVGGVYAAVTKAWAVVFVAAGLAVLQVPSVF